MKTEATGASAATTVDTDEATAGASAGTSTEGKAAETTESTPAKSVTKDSVETQTGDQPAELGGKDSGRKGATGTLVAKATDLTGASGTTTTVKGPNTAAVKPVTVQAEKTFAGLNDAQAGDMDTAMTAISDVNTVVGTGNNVQSIARNWNTIKGIPIRGGNTKMMDTINNGKLGADGAGTFLDTFDKGMKAFNAGKNAATVWNDIKNGGISSDSVMPIADTVVDVVGEIKNPYTLAFSTGWGIGRTLDNTFGISDKASDKMAYGTTDPWAGDVTEGRANMEKYKARMARRRANKKARAKAKTEEYVTRKRDEAPKAAGEAPRLDAANTRVDSNGRVYVNGEYSGRYENGRFISANR